MSPPRTGDFCCCAGLRSDPMRTTILTLVKALGQSVPLLEPIYEFGSYRVAAQRHRGSVRDCFPGKKFIGCDVRPGPGVDEIQDLHRLSLRDESVGTALLLDTIEHVREPWRAMAELHRCLVPGGIIVMTSVLYFPIHAYPDDYWRFTASGFSSLLQMFDIITVEMRGLRKLPHTVLGIASKGPVAPAVRLAICDTVASWKRRGSRSWKEVMMAVSPPFLLIPAYDAFMWALEKSRGERPGEHD